MIQSQIIFRTRKKIKRKEAGTFVVPASLVYVAKAIGIANTMPDQPMA